MIELSPRKYKTVRIALGFVEAACLAYMGLSLLRLVAAGFEDYRTLYFPDPCYQSGFGLIDYAKVESSKGGSEHEFIVSCICDPSHQLRSLVIPNSMLSSKPGLQKIELYNIGERDKESQYFELSALVWMDGTPFFADADHIVETQQKYCPQLFDSNDFSKTF